MPEIFQFDFMIRAFEAGIAIALIAPLIGIFLVVRRYSLMADTLAHVSFAGVALGILLHTVNPIITALITSVVAALGIERLRHTRKIFGESILALFLSGSLAIAVIIIGLAQGFNVNILSYLFGNISTIAPSDLTLIVALAIVVTITIIFFYKGFFSVSFDEELAKAGGMKVRMINMLIVALAAVTVSLAIRIVGVLLIGSLMVIPVITAMQFGRGFRDTMLLGILFSVVSVISGLFLSYYWNIASGGTIVIVALAIFLLSLLLNRQNS